MANIKYRFFDDYSEGAHPQILAALNKTNLNQETGYGQDTLSLKAADLIKNKIQNKKAEVHFVTGGTQANLVVLASLMKPFEAVIAAKTAHIYNHEAGAIEATGHKVICVDSTDGKIKPSQIKEILESHIDEHMVKPKVVFISQATELGTVYSKKELADISKICRENNLYLFLDGARLGSALTAESSDLTLSDVAKLVDVFYLGGTKNGALLGEAIVICRTDLAKDFRYNLKQRGALLAKGRILGVQFIELFQNDLYFVLAKRANQMANKIANELTDLEVNFLTHSPTNQIFPILSNTQIEKLSNLYGFYVWSKVNDEKSAIRLVTSWATPEKVVDEFLKDLKSILI